MRCYFVIVPLLLLIGFSPATKAQSSPTLEDIIKQDDLVAFRNMAIPPEDHFSTLLNCIENSAQKIGSRLIAQLEDPDQKGNNGRAALHAAVRAGQYQLTEALLAHGADVNLPADDTYGTTPLMMATAQDNPKVFQLLIERGADINAIDQLGDPVVNWAAYYGNLAALQALVSHKADLSHRSKHGNAADVILRLWHADSLLQVFSGTDLAAPLTQEQQKLLQCIEQNDIPGLKQLLHSGADPNTTDAFGTPLLHKAVYNDNAAIIKLLLQYHSDIDAYNRVGQTALTIAARFARREIVALLLQLGASPRASGEQYRLSPIIGAAVGGDMDIAKMLIGAGADPDRTEPVNQATALHWAAFYRHEPLLLYLLEQGANYQLKIFDETTDLQALAESLQLEKVVAKLLSYTAAKEALAGSWIITNINYIYADTTYEVTAPAPGIFMGAPERYMILYHPTSKPRKAFSDFSDPSCEDLRNAYQNLVFNTGNYHLTDSLLVAHPDIARVPGFEGARQVYRMAVSEEQLSLTLFDETYPNGEKPTWHGKLEIQLTFRRE